MARSVLLSCQSVGKAYGTRSLFDDLSFGLLEGDQACLVGPNGSGKSTLLRILAGVESPDRGSRSLRGGIRVGYVPQDPVFDPDVTIADVIGRALAEAPPDERPGRLAQTLGRAGFSDGDASVGTLSGGRTKRLAIARELAAAPDVLLLDEPTNHLDVDGILWLEALLSERARACLVVSHDRYFLERVATRMLELDRGHPGGLFECEGGYGEFLARRDEALRARATYDAALANTVRREIEWMRRGAKARSTKARGRIQAAGRLVEELADRRTRSEIAAAGIDFAPSLRRTRRLLATRGLTKSLGGRRLVSDLDLVVTPGVRVGVIGPNSSGKTILLDLLVGSVAPDAGHVERAEGLRVVRFEQERGGLDPAQSLRRALAPDGDAVTWQGRSLHVAAWAKRFLFRPEQLEVPVGRLSGGERARVLIARLMRQPADVLVLDEPTNDLDIPTLEVLEDSLVEFDGALLLVTHDRLLLERVSTLIVALDGEGGTAVFADYPQWEAARPATARSSSKAAPPAPVRARTRPRRLGYREQREWDGMEQAILEAERAVDACRRETEDPSIASDSVALLARYAALESAQAEVDRLYARWAELEAKQA